MPASLMNITRGVNRFRKGFMNGDTFDEPTYLTFAIDFDFTGEKINPMTNLVASPLFNQTDPVTSAYLFLQNYSPNDAQYIPSIISMLQNITDKTPWYFQSLDGLNDMWNNTVRMGPALKSKTVLTVGCLESLDLRIATIANLYRKIVYDQHNMRWKLPDNLRYFSMDVYVAEIRNYRDILNTGITSFANSTNGDSGGNALLQGHNVGAPSTMSVNPNTNVSISNALDHFGYFKYRCYQCEFDFADGLKNNYSGFTAFTQKDPFTTGFKIKVGYFEEQHYLKDQFIGGGDSLDLLGIANSLGPFANVTTSALLRGDGALNKVTSVPTQLLNSAVSEIQQLVENGSLGNVYKEDPVFNETPLFNLGNVFK